MDWWNIRDRHKIVQPCCFQYATSDRSTCGGCQIGIAYNALRVKYYLGSRFYHFDCFWKYETTAKCKKDEIMIAVRDTTPTFEVLSEEMKNRQHVKYFFDSRFVSLDVLDQNMAGMSPGLEPIIHPENIERIREQVALAQKGKIPYYVPTILTDCLHFCPYCFSFNDPPKSYFERDKEEKKYCLKFDNVLYHPHCLAESGIVNLKAKKFHGYDTLDDNEKEYMNGLFKKKKLAAPIFMAHTQLGFEHCASKNCINREFGFYFYDSIFNKISNPLQENFYPHQRYIKNGDLRIRYKHLSYHPQCFAALGKVNVDGKDIQNYDKLDDRNKMILDSYFIKSDDFDIPCIHNTKNDRVYCNAENCEYSPSMFPYPYTITRNKVYIRYKGDNYHPTCFQASGNINMNAKDMRNYENLTDKKKQILDEIFKKMKKRKLQEEDQSNADSQEDNNDEEPSTKKKKSNKEVGETLEDAEVDHVVTKKKTKKSLKEKEAKNEDYNF